MNTHRNIDAVDVNIVGNALAISEHVIGQKLESGT